MSTPLHVTFSPRFVAPSTVGLKQENLQLPHVNSTSTAGLALILPLPLHTITACSLSPLPELRGQRERSDVVTAVSDISFGPGAVAAAEVGLYEEDSHRREGSSTLIAMRCANGACAAASAPIRAGAPSESMRYQ